MKNSPPTHNNQPQYKQKYKNRVDHWRKSTLLSCKKKSNNLLSISNVLNEQITMGYLLSQWNGKLLWWVLVWKFYILAKSKLFYLKLFSGLNCLSWLRMDNIFQQIFTFNPFFVSSRDFFLLSFASLWIIILAAANAILYTWFL